MFKDKYYKEDIEEKYAGLYCLLRLANDPNDEISEESSRLMHLFFFPEFHVDSPGAKGRDLNSEKRPVFDFTGLSNQEKLDK